jgi:hypothetical protein
MEVTAVYSRRRLAEAIIDETDVVGVVLDLEEDSREWSGFISSLLRSFPVLPIMAITTNPQEGCPDMVTCVARDATAPELESAFAKLVAGAPQERRQHHRYQWPLRATIAGDSTVHRISEISASGAFLEPSGPSVQPGDEREIDISFQNFRMRVRCTILDPRRLSSRNTHGFGVRFQNLSEEAAAFVNRVVNDALITILVDPDAEPDIPTMDEDEDLLSIGDEFALT